MRAETIAGNVAQVREELARAATRAGRDPAAVQVLAATKYVAIEDMPKLAQAGVQLVGENRVQDLQAKVDAHGDMFTWDFIGRLQSRKVRQVIPHVRLIHSVASDSVLRELARHQGLARPGMRVLIEVNVANEPGKEGVAPAELEGFIERCPAPVAGLMTMPPLSRQAEQSRRWFAALRELAHRHGLMELSMGTTQDYLVAVEEGATIVRIGTRLYA
jgi:pyridoxal phosphate enzyme (YggS family)